MAELPEGTVTFLFSDVEGSTQLLERFGDRLTAALTRHHELLSGAVAAHGGVVFETVGDAVYAAFSEPANGAAAALAAQRAMVESDWAELGDVRIRISLHTGSVERRGAHYVGAPLFRAARILALAHGGQTLLSAATADVVRGGLGDGAILRDLGRHRLKDLVEPEEVHQLDAAGLPTIFPPLRSVEARFDNLPGQLSSFVGREAELETVAAALQTSRLVTLIGPGGTGKTRLAIEAAGQARDRYADGIAFIDLAPVRDPYLVAAAIASTLGIRPVGGEPAEAALIRWLADRRLLLVLDNFEQIVEATPILGRLLAGAPDVTLMVTSRETLRHRGERTFEVPPLGLPDAHTGDGHRSIVRSEAFRLFCERADLDPETIPGPDVGVIAEICRRVDGLPLAIELAASRIGLLGPAALLDRLDHRLTILSGGARDLPDRQRALRATIDWSVSLLTDEERDLFERLAVFAGGWTTETAERVAARPIGAPAVLDGLESLVAKSLVRTVGGDHPRSTMLETIREYANERLDARRDADDVRRSHALWILELAEAAEPELVRSDQMAWIRRFRSEADNVRTALSWAIERGESEIAKRVVGAVWRYWYLGGGVREGIEWIQRALALPVDGPDRVEGRALLAFAHLGCQVGLLDESERALQAALPMLQASGAEADLAEVFVDLGNVRVLSERVEEAIPYYEEARSRWEAIGDFRGRSTPTMNLGACWLELGDPVAAETLYREALELERSAGDEVGVIEVLANLADLMVRSGRSEAADSLSREAIERCLAIGHADPFFLGAVFETLARVRFDQGQFADAGRLLGAYRATRTRLGLWEPPLQASQVRSNTDRLIGTLGKDVLDAYLSEGTALTIEGAMELALDVGDERAALSRAANPADHHLREA